MIFKCVTDLDLHIETVHTVNSSEHPANDIFIQQNETCFKCEKCKFIGNASDLEKHMKKKHSALVSCKNCGIHFSDPDIVQQGSTTQSPFLVIFVVWFLLILYS